MSIKDLLVYLSKEVQFPVPIDAISAWLLSNDIIGTIALTRADIDPKILKGLFVAENDNKDCTVYYSSQLNYCWRRFVQCKELLHAFDYGAARANSMEEIDEITFGLLTRTITELVRDGSLPEISDKLGEVPALLALAPMSIVNRLREQYDNKSKSDYDMALYFRIPEVYISLLFHPEFKVIADDILK